MLLRFFVLRTQEILINSFDCMKNKIEFRLWTNGQHFLNIYWRIVISQSTFRSPKWNYGEWYFEKISYTNVWSKFAGSSPNLLVYPLEFLQLIFFIVLNEARCSTSYLSWKSFYWIFLRANPKKPPPNRVIWWQPRGGEQEKRRRR